VAGLMEKSVSVNKRVNVAVTVGGFAMGSSPTLTHDSKPPDFFPISAYGGAEIVSIISPAGVMKMDDEIAVVGGHAIVEIDLANGLQVSNGLSLTFWVKKEP